MKQTNERKNGMKKLFVFTLGILIVLTGMGYAAEKKTPEFSKSEKKARNYLKKMDKDQDGRISKAEFNDRELERFKNMDKDSDGSIVLSEWGKDRSKGFVKVDTDKNKKIIKKEWLTKREKSFLRMDKNKDGYLSVTEVAGSKFKK
jgi:Ca2+-binding EF-hand superfamily protein